MKTTRLITFLIVFISLLSFEASAQKALKKGNMQFNLKAYDLAVASFTRALEENEDCTECIFMIAESYRMMNKNIDAALWFRKLDGRSDVPDKYKLSYGLTMKRMGQYEKAQGLFFDYKLVDPLVGEHYAQSCDFAMSNLGDAENVEISLFKTSSRQSDFAPSLWQNKLLFSSFRTDLRRKDSQLNKSYIQNQGSQLFMCAKNGDGRNGEFDFFRTDLEEDYTISYASVSGDNQNIAYVKANFVDGFKQVVSDEMDISLYTATLSLDGTIENEKAFNFNEIGYATAFPSLNFNGKILYFASNREGGYGGYDLYVSYYKNNEWSYPENLGDKINTAGNEVSPHFNGDKLFFASDYHHGFGGFDVFQSSVFNGAWQFPVNIGQGVNSPEDDMNLIVDGTTGIYYFTSNRLGGKGNHDIYTALPVMDHDLAIIDLKATDNEYVPSAVSLIDLPTNNTESNPRVVNVSENEVLTSPEEKVTEAVMDEFRKAVVELEGEPKLDNNPPAAFDLTDLEKENIIKSSLSSNENKSELNLVGAKRVAFGEVIRSNTNVYFIQLAAIFENRADISSFSRLRSFGSLYKMQENSAIKIRLGYYLDQHEAKEILSKVKNAGYRDAFITQRPLDTQNMELALSSDKLATDDYYGIDNSQYKVRLASYEDPIYFDVNLVKDIGVIEQWSKRNWTIFVLGGFSNLEEAEHAKIKALNRGFVDATVVVDNNGVLEKLVKN